MLISVDEAIVILNHHLGDFGTESIPLDQAWSRVIREDIHADRPMPPYNRVTMDGIAILHRKYRDGQRQFAIESVAAAGDIQKQLKDESHCIEVMTGAMLPVGTDTVIRYEDLEINDEVANIMQAVKEGQNIHFQGEDRQAGDLLVQSGTVFSPAEIGVSASTGKARVLVSRQPRILLISTGNELVEIDQVPLPHQIRKSNVYRISSTLESLRLHADIIHVNDDLAEIDRVLEKALSAYDILLLSGGVSKGKFDFLPEALEARGVIKHFHRIAQRPGKPFWFGSHPSGPTVFAFPGNPISSFLCTHAYFIPWIKKSMGFPELKEPKAVLAEDVVFKPDLTYYLEITLEFGADGRLLAFPRKGHGSGDLANLLRADAFIKLPRGQDFFEAGAVYPVIPFRNFIGC